MKIILDAMGGDLAPQAPVMGAIRAAKDFGAQITLVGRGEEILKVLKDNGIQDLPTGITVCDAEEVVDMGVAVACFGYNDVAIDEDDGYLDPIPQLLRKGPQPENGWAKIALWAWAAQRVMDYAQTLDILDLKYAIVCGHSRLGKTALLAAATDERFTFGYSNDSGCGGAAITREKAGETVEDICKKFPYWFCENYLKYVGQESKMPFDQHFLIASIAPRFVCVGSALEDIWADPNSEMLACIAASPIYKQYGMDGFLYVERQQKAGDVYHEGSIGYHMRGGTHYFSREDWLQLIRFINLHNTNS
jgi:hypothetical protein